MSQTITGRTYKLIRYFSTRSSRYCQSVQPLEQPPSICDPLVVSPKIENLVNEIGKLTLIEASELNTALKKKFDLPDFSPASFDAGAHGKVEAEDDGPSASIGKSSFTLKLQKFDETKKIAVIKEIKSILSDLNLVQAKKFVESVPVIVKADLGKDEAEKLKEALEKAGAECIIS